MKKLLIVLAFAGVSLTGAAQDEPTLKYSVATNSFWSNWFVQGNFAYSAFYSNEEKHEGFNKSPLKDFRNGYGFSVAVGKWFTPGIGVRAKFNGLNGKSVITDGKTVAEVAVRQDPSLAANPRKSLNTNKYWNAQVQTLFNLSNIFFGYNESRVWNFIPYLGVGPSRNCTYNTYNLVGSAGVLNTFRVSKRVAVNLDLNYNLSGDDFEGVEWGWGRAHDEAHDRWFNAEVGLTLNVGKVGWNKVPDVDAIKALSQSQIDALKAQLADANAENDRLKNLLANQPKPEPAITQSVKEFITTPVSVFFNLDKTEIAELKDLVNVRALAKYAVENNSNLLVTGYADSATGTPAHNQVLSEKRAKRVADELVKMGVSESKISQEAKGGVDILSPISYNRRATVQITD